MVEWCSLVCVECFYMIELMVVVLMFCVDVHVW